MNRIFQRVLLILLLIYVVSPVDFAPGPVDDLIMCLLYAVGSKVLPGSGN